MKRTRTATSLFLTVSALFVVVQGCNTSTDLQQPPQSTDGGTDTTTTGGSPTVGPQTTGGSNTTPGATGGTVGNTGGAGNNNTGGTPGNPQGGAATGGKANNPTGGTPGNPQGGAATGGSPVATGGSPVIGATGGSPVITATGGSGVITATGGSPVTVGGATGANSGKVVTITNGKALGAMTGWGFIARGSLDPVTDPTCDAAKTAYPAGSGCVSTTNWNSTTALCATGSVPALPATPTDADYKANFGINIGVGAAEATGGTLGQSFTSVTISTTGAPATGLRAIVSVGATDYCATLTSGTAIPFTTFNTTCWTPTTAGALPAASVPNITQVQVQVTSGAAAITVTNLCITGITFS